MPYLPIKIYEVRLKRVVVTVLALLMPALAVVPAHAGALLRLTPQGLTPSAYEAMGFPLDPAEIPSEGFRLTYHGGGSDQLVNPVMLIIGVPNASLVAPALTVGALGGLTSAAVDVGDTQTRYGGTWNTTTGFAGTFSNTTNPKVYNYIGFTPQGSDSENYANWSGATGLTSWNLFVYALTFNPRMEHGDYAEFNTSLPDGAYVIGYGCEVLSTAGLCKKAGVTQSTPFTFAGRVVTEVPEPSSMALLLAGLAAAALSVRKTRVA